MPELSNVSVETGGDEKRRDAVSEADGRPLKTKPTREDGTEYPDGLRFALICLALCMSVFLMALDTSIIATAIPKITDEFHSLADVGWYGSGQSSHPCSGRSTSRQAYT